MGLHSYLVVSLFLSDVNNAIVQAAHLDFKVCELLKCFDLFVVIGVSLSHLEVDVELLNVPKKES